jgi:hypothetical protein
MLYACVQRFDVTGNLKILAKFLASKRCPRPLAYQLLAPCHVSRALHIFPQRTFVLYYSDSRKFTILHMNIAAKVQDSHNVYTKNKKFKASPLEQWILGEFL